MPIALLIGGASFIDEVTARLGTRRDRFSIVPGRRRHRALPPGRRGTRWATPPIRSVSSITAASTAGRARSTSSTRSASCGIAACRSAGSSRASGRTSTPAATGWRRCGSATTSTSRDMPTTTPCPCSTARPTSSPRHLYGGLLQHDPGGDGLGAPGRVLPGRGRGRLPARWRERASDRARRRPGSGRRAGRHDPRSRPAAADRRRRPGGVPASLFLVGGRRTDHGRLRACGAPAPRHGFRPRAADSPECRYRAEPHLL